MAKVIRTCASEKQYFAESAVEWTEDAGRENQLFTIYPQKTYQTILGFGGAFTEAGGYAVSKLSAGQQMKAVEAYFTEEGLGYRFCRTHINSCDFSLGNYTYVEEGDETLESFSVKKDEEYLLPLIRKAREAAGDGITMMASPWSPPAYMKTNGDMNHGGSLKPEYRKLWADYLVKYLLAYRDLGITVTYLSIQNEPKAVQTWDSCIYTPKEELEFAEAYLRPALTKAGLDVKLLAWDHNKERVYENAAVYFGKPGEGRTAVDGIGFHWYSGDHFRNLQMTYEDYPEKPLIFTEGCVEYSRFAAEGDVFRAEMYGHDMIGNFNHGCAAHIDWNLYLDEKGGPNHVGNYCAAPVMCDTEKDTFEKKLSYYYIGHFSRYIKPGAKRIGLSGYTDKIDACGFINPDGQLVVVLMNRQDTVQKAAVRQGGRICELLLTPHSIVTFLEDGR